MKQQTRELLIITKIAGTWHDDFDQKVDELMAIVTRVDTEKRVHNAIEVLDVYRKKKMKSKAKRKKPGEISSDRPFEFAVFRN
ncbi:MAG: hypothetical protein P4L41_03080 [Flavipsychrobacter sp.]|nr:hypothetical protein [Flavipsychrobacter sp.]